MHLIIVAFAAGLALSGWLALRHAVRTAVTVPPVSELPAPAGAALKPMEVWEAGIKPDTLTDYTPEPAAMKRLREKLRQEELRQRPQEESN